MPKGGRSLLKIKKQHLEAQITIITIEQPLYPQPAQLLALHRQWDIARTVWSLLARQHELDGQGLDVTLATLLTDNIPAGNLVRPGGSRTTTQRAEEVRALGLSTGWAVDVGAETLSDVASAFGRAARAGQVSLQLPADFGLFLGGLARPLTPLAVEIGGLDAPVPAPEFLLPAAARCAMAGWRTRVLGRLGGQRDALSQLALAGDAEADAQLLAHVARWGELTAQGQPPLPPPCAVVRLTLLEHTRLRWVSAPGGPQPRLLWTFGVDDITGPHLTGLIAADPGMRRIWTTCSAGGLTYYTNPMAGRWRPPAPTTPPGMLRRPWDLELACLHRQAMLVQRHIQPVQDAAFQHLMAHPDLAVEALDLDGFARLRADYLGWLHWSGALIQHRYVLDVAAVSRRLVVVPARAGATRLCSICRTPRSVRFWGRRGRCRACGTRLDRDANAARNLYRLGRAGLP